MRSTGAGNIVGAGGKTACKLFDKRNNNDYPFCTLKDRENYIETVITFASGDQLRVACERIII